MNNLIINKVTDTNLTLFFSFLHTNKLIINKVVDINRTLNITETMKVV